MRLVTFSRGDGVPRPGVYLGDPDDGEVVDLLVAANGTLPATLEGILGYEDGLRLVADLVALRPPSLPAREVRLMAPLQGPGKFIAVAGNYPEHVSEVGGRSVVPVQSVPRLFIKPATTLLGPSESLVLPGISREMDWECELGVAIGRRGRDVSPRDAIGMVAAYCVVNDISARSLEWGVDDREVSEWDPFFDWLVGKWLDRSAPTGPWLVTADEIGDPQDLRLETRVNGQLRQAASTGDMTFSVAELVAHASRIMTLEPGDLLATGTPAGVGAVSGTYLKPGDVIEARVDRIGSLRTPVVARPLLPPAPAPVGRDALGPRG
jgi:2-keto-4-pentenoate hydratase/2-oxohepta-3-ene-1,7-dioic acid hydratase in catechol pathway